MLQFCFIGSRNNLIMQDDSQDSHTFADETLDFFEVYCAYNSRYLFGNNLLEF